MHEGQPLEEGIQPDGLSQEQAPLETRREQYAETLKERLSVMGKITDYFGITDREQEVMLMDAQIEDRIRDAMKGNPQSVELVIEGQNDKWVSGNFFSSTEYNKIYPSVSTEYDTNALRELLKRVDYAKLTKPKIIDTERSAEYDGSHYKKTEDQFYRYGLEASIDGIKLEVYPSMRGEPGEGTVDGERLSPEQADEIFKKYSGLAAIMDVCKNEIEEEEQLRKENAQTRHTRAQQSIAAPV